MSSLTPEIIVMFCLIGLTVFIFAADIVRVDVGAISIMLLLALTSLIPGLEPLLPPEKIFSGFASNAVIAIIAVMILGAGLDKTGILKKLASLIIRVGGNTEKKLTAWICGAVGLTSSFMQNTGAAALFIPVAGRIAARSGLAINRLLMPMGFCAIVGGTLTTVGSSPLILLNDLLPKSIEPIQLFEVTPVGLALVCAGILYFLLLGKWLLPPAKRELEPVTTTMDYLKKVYALDAAIYEIQVPPNSKLVGMSIENIEAGHAVRIVAAQIGKENRVSPARDLQIEPNSVIAVLGSPAAIEYFVERYQLNICKELIEFADSLTSTQAGISEIVIPPNSDLIGKTISELWMRKTYGLTVLNIRRGEENHNKDLRDLPLQPGDTLVCHSSWHNLARLLKDKNFVVITTEFPHEELRPHKVHFAIGFLLLAIIMVLATPLPLSVSLMCGALGMILTGVLSMDEAYESINWTTVFLLASLIPVGLAVENSGTAAWIAQSVLNLTGDVSVWVLQLMIAILATFFSLTMSNVGATVLLVPLVVNMATTIGADPRIFALTAAIAASNAFILPTHQVNALIMGPGGYKVRDFMRAGIGMTVIYLLVSLTVLNLIF